MSTFWNGICVFTLKNIHFSMELPVRCWNDRRNIVMFWLFARLSLKCPFLHAMSFEVFIISYINLFSSNERIKMGHFWIKFKCDDLIVKKTVVAAERNWRKAIGCDFELNYDLIISSELNEHWTNVFWPIHNPLNTVSYPNECYFLDFAVLAL